MDKWLRHNHHDIGNYLIEFTLKQCCKMHYAHTCASAAHLHTRNISYVNIKHISMRNAHIT